MPWHNDVKLTTDNIYRQVQGHRSLFSTQKQKGTATEVEKIDVKKFHSLVPKKKKPSDDVTVFHAYSLHMSETTVDANQPESSSDPEVGKLLRESLLYYWTNYL